MFVIDIHIIVRTVVTFLAIYGLYYLILDVCSFIKSCNSNRRKTNPVIVVKVKNHEESLECVIRNLILKYMNNLCISSMPDILIVDFGSEDSTPEIARRLAEDFPFVYCTTSDLYAKAVESSNDKSA